MKKVILLALSGLVLLAGCKDSGDKAAGIPVGPKWKGAPYRLTLDSKDVKPNRKGITLPAVKFSANPEALETRVVLIVRFDGADGASEALRGYRMIGPAVDIKGAESAVPADYVDRASKGFTDFLTSYCLKGKVKLSVALARSSLSPQATLNEVEAKRLSDWQSIEADFKAPNLKCKAAAK